MSETEWKISIEDTVAELIVLHAEMERQVDEITSLLARLTEAVHVILLPEVKA